MIAIARLGRRLLCVSRRRTAVSGLLLLLAATPAAAQQPAPGYVVTRFEAVRVEHAPRSRGTAERLARGVVRASEQVEAALGVPPPPRPHVILASTDAEFAARYQQEAGRPPRGAFVLAVAFSGRNLVIVRGPGIDEGGASGLLPTLAHELAHLAVGRVEARRGRRLPLWLNEGLAELASGRRPTLEERAAFAGWAKFGQMPRLADLTTTFPAHGAGSARAYTVALGFVTWLDERAPVARLVSALGRHPTADAAFREVYGHDVRELELDWLIALTERHSYWKSLLLSFEPWALIGFLALLAAIRHFVRRRRLMRELAEADEREQAAEADGLA